MKRACVDQSFGTLWAKRVALTLCEGIRSGLGDRRWWWDGSSARTQAPGFGRRIWPSWEFRWLHERWLFLEVEHVEEAVGIGIAAGEGRKVPLLLDGLEDRGVVIDGVRHKVSFGVRTDH